MSNIFTFITGATGGLGKAFCYNCAAAGNNLFLTGRNTAALENLKKRLNEHYPSIRIEYFACLLSDENSRLQMFEYIESLNISFDRLCNIAGVDIQKAFVKYTQEKVISQVRVNIEGTLSVTLFALTKRAENLEILTVSSMSAMCPMPYFAIYSSTKYALISFFKSLKHELKGQNVKITTVAPGGIPTRPDIIEDIKGQGLWGKLSCKSPEYVAKNSLKALSKNKTVYIPGSFNRILSFFMGIIPQGLKMKFISKRWEKLEKDAF